MPRWPTDHQSVPAAQRAEATRKRRLALLERYRIALHRIADETIDLDGEACMLIAREALEDP